MTPKEQAIAILNELIAMNNRSTIAGQIGKAVDLLNQDEPVVLTENEPVVTQQILDKSKKG